MLKSKLSVLLAERGIRQEYLSEKTGISKTTISNISNNKTNGLKYETLNELSKFLQVTPGEMFDYYSKDITLSIREYPLDIRDLRIPFLDDEPTDVTIEGCFFNISGAKGLTNKIGFFITIKDAFEFQNENSNYVDAWGDSDYLIEIKTNKMNDLAPDSLDPFLEDLPKTFLSTFEQSVIDFFTDTLYSELEDKTILRKGKYTIHINTREQDLYIPLKIKK
ncbi:hypothetical protein FPFC_060910 [Fructobacillus pseudoficulneus]|uniref:HTH cro/C1-type domain-containing protein n=1 Tax=Fructobacillus pseudoficulneus TaxID=220714 RepID=A0A3F3H4X3_9LACO|nr:helix-turn-helix transcriptional regulator [Fructobacillus pseudoficulneus]GAP03368.1 hypothetical protein FPFC_060910 [Fructobacillus pseudoficulneus]SEH43721.1 DNA-binding transcriptional regulator, XRE family [Fructobacillus pseudoficulneus]